MTMVLTVMAESAVSMTVPVTAGWFGRSNGDSSAIIAPDYVRLQVVANSNSDYDQKVKALVSATVRSVLADGVHVPKDSPSALGFAAASQDAVQSAVQDVLGKCGCTYGVAVHVGDLDFPAKSYGGTIAPPGSYPALRVTLGTGRGDNWWCVLFPPHQ